jgi:hypothetical protein
MILRDLSRTVIRILSCGKNSVDNDIIIKLTKRQPNLSVS